MNSQSTILLVEDNSALAASLGSHLASLGYSVEHASDGQIGLELALTESFDLAILDIELPSRSGLEICQAMRAHGHRYPILMLTSRDQEIDEVVGLNTGADDYMTKPFGLAPLVARINALLRRGSSIAMGPSAGAGMEALQFGNLAISPEKRRVYLADAEVELTAKEFDLLLLLASHPGHVFSRDELLREIWESELENYQNAISSVVLRLRKKIEVDYNNPRYVLTVRGVGYRFAEMHEL